MSAPTFRLVKEDTVFLLCDVQERFRDVIDRMQHVIATASTMLKGAEALGIPVVVTEQYPKALLHTVEELDVSKAIVFEKTRFSMFTEEVRSHIASLGRSTFVLFGVETHVCVQQTALDLIDAGYKVHVVADGVSSQRADDRAVALDRLRQSGVLVTTAESVLFDLLRTKDAAQFKEVSGIVKAHGEAVKELGRHI